MDKQTQSKETREVQVTRVFNAPVEEVWKAWVDPQLVQQWWGPTGFTCPLAQMNFREGGTSLVSMRPPQEYGGQDLYNTWTYTKIEPYQRFEYILRFTDQAGNPLEPAELGMPAGVPPEVRNVNLFKSLEDGQTELTIIESGYTTPQAAEVSRQGLEQCLDKMATIFA